MKLQKNVLRLGDNLPLLRDKSLFPDESIDLIYLDPPLNPHRGSHAVAKEIDTSPSGPLIPTPVNIWRWNEDAAERYEETLHLAPERLRSVMIALKSMLGYSAMFAYLVHMTPRLVQLHRVLKRTGSLFLHCDPISSHYLKILLDAIFGQRSLVNEVVWKRVSGKELPAAANHMARIHDIILYFRKSDRATFNTQHVLCSEEYMDHFYPDVDAKTGRRFRLGDLTTAKKPSFAPYDWRIKRDGDDGAWQGDLDNEWKHPKPGVQYKVIPPVKNRYWALPREILIRTDEEGMIVYNRMGYPQVKRFATAQGVPVQDIWTDIAPVVGNERLYITQKPKALLERIIAMASNPGDVILDAFAGSGPTIDAVESLNRQNSEKEPRSWIGIEASYLATTLIKNRLGRFRGPSAKYKVIGDIKDIRAAELLAARDNLEFQYWAFGLLGARPWGGEKVRKTDTRDVDGIRMFQDGTSPVLRPILIQVKNGNVKLDDIRGLEGFRRRTKSPMGVYISLQDPTRDALEEAAAAGTYFCPATRLNYPRLQIVTVEQLLEDTSKPSTAVALPPRFPGEVFK